MNLLFPQLQWQIHVRMINIIKFKAIIFAKSFDFIYNHLIIFITFVLVRVTLTIFAVCLRLYILVSSGAWHWSINILASFVNPSICRLLCLLLFCPLYVVIKGIFFENRSEWHLKLYLILFFILFLFLLVQPGAIGVLSDLLFEIVYFLFE